MAAANLRRSRGGTAPPIALGSVTRCRSIDTGAGQCRDEALDTHTHTRTDENADILILGSRGLSAIKKAFVGSVSEYCVHHVQCPVIVVRNKKEGQRVISEATVLEAAPAPESAKEAGAGRSGTISGVSVSGAKEE